MKEITKINIATPYMLREDNKLLACDSIHPYIKYNYDMSSSENLSDLFKEHFEDVEWFYNNTAKDSTKKLIESFLISIKETSELVEDLVDDDFFEEKLDSTIDKLNLNKSSKDIVKSQKELLYLYDQLNTVTNQEFCRMRMSSLKYGGNSNEAYFRISSLHHNWYDSIWKVVSDNSSISDVTICKDTQTFGGRYEPYMWHDIKIDHLPREEFLTLKGNPVIEKYTPKSEVDLDMFKDFFIGKTLSESLYYMHPRYANSFYKECVKRSLEYDIRNILSVKDMDEIIDKKIMNESMKLLEKSRQELINKSKAGAEYTSKDRQGQNRWTRRKYSSVANSVRDYNNINMDIFFKDDILEFVVKVHGETDNYEVTITFSNILRNLQREVKSNDNKLEFKCVLRALLYAFNSDDVFVGCTCKDWIFSGFNYYGVKQQYNSAPILGKAMQAPRIKNPLDNKGACCKHINLVLANTDWMMKVASVINNYIKWTKENMTRNYADIIFPAVYGMPYNRAVQLSLFDDPDNNGLLPSDQDTISKVIDKTMKARDDKGKFIQGNEYRFSKQDTIKSKQAPEDAPGQLKLINTDTIKAKQLKIPEEEKSTEE